MYHYNLYLTDAQMDRMKNLAERTKRSVAEHVRSLVDLAEPLHDCVLSGAKLLYLQAVTSSGVVLIHGGY